MFPKLRERRDATRVKIKDDIQVLCVQSARTTRHRDGRVLPVQRMVSCSLNSSTTGSTEGQESILVL